MISFIFYFFCFHFLKYNFYCLTLYSSFSEPVSEPVPYRTFTKLKDQNSQKLLDGNLKCKHIFIELASLYQNIILLLISVE